MEHFDFDKRNFCGKDGFQRHLVILKTLFALSGILVCS